MNGNVYKWIAGFLVAVILSLSGYALNAIDSKADKVAAKVDKQQEQLHKIDKETSTAIVETKVKLEEIEKQGKRVEAQLADLLEELRRSRTSNRGQ